MNQLEGYLQPQTWKRSDREGIENRWGGCTRLVTRPWHLWLGCIYHCSSYVTNSELSSTILWDLLLVASDRRVLRACPPARTVRARGDLSPGTCCTILSEYCPASSASSCLPVLGGYHAVQSCKQSVWLLNGGVLEICLKQCGSFFAGICWVCILILFFDEQIWSDM